MKIFAMLLASLTIHAAAYQPRTIEAGTKAPDFSLKGVDGKKYSLKDFSGGKALAVIFTTNHCPDAITSHGRMVTLVDRFKGKGVKFVAINSNSPEGLHPQELSWTVYDDGFEDMKLIAVDRKFNLPYLYDGDTQEVAKAYGAVATPHVFIFDAELKLRYDGRMDNGRRRMGPVEKNEAHDALTAILAGREVAVKKTRPVGCSLKWKEKAGKVLEEDEKWKAQPVTVELVKADTISKLIKNKDRKGMRLFTVWSIRCDLCVDGFPDLAAIYRQYSRQEFEFIPISLGSTDSVEEVRQFLKRQQCGLSSRTKPFLEEDGRKTNNLIFDGDTEKLANVLDFQWNRGVPLTFLVGPEGEILFRQAGKIEPLVLKKVIVKQVWEKNAE